MRFIVRAWVISIFLYGYFSNTNSQFSSRGQQFVVSFTYNNDQSQNGKPGANFLFVSSEEPGNFTIDYYGGTSLTFPLLPNKAVSIHLPDHLEMPQETGIQRVGVLVKADVDIAVYALNDDMAGNSEDSYTVLPVTALSRRYVVPTSSNNPQLAVTGVAENTKVTITLKTTCDVSWKQNTYKSGDSIQVSLDTLEVFQLATDFDKDSRCDFGGTQVESNNPVSVISGASCAVSKDACDHVVEQVLPLEFWGKRFIIPDLHDSADIQIRVVSAEDWTKFYVNQHHKDGTKLTRTYKVDANQSLDLVAPDGTFTEIFSFNNLSVTEFSTCSAPFTIPIPSVERFGWNYTVSTLDNMYSSNFTSFANIVIDSDNVQSLLLDDAAPHPSHWSVVNDLGFCIATIPLDKGSHHFQADGPFMLQIYGYTPQGSYAYNAGFGFDHLLSDGLDVKVPTMPPTTAPTTTPTTTATTTTTTPTTTTDATSPTIDPRCQDNPNIDCKHLDEELGVCQDVNIAHKYCRRYCGNCSDCSKPGGCGQIIG